MVAVGRWVSLTGTSDKWDASQAVTGWSQAHAARSASQRAACCSCNATLSSSTRGQACLVFIWTLSRTLPMPISGVAVNKAKYEVRKRHFMSHLSGVIMSAEAFVDR